MKIIILIILFFYINSVSYTKDNNDVVVYIKDKCQNGYNLLNGCMILSMNGDIIKEYPGALCTYFKNGNIISSINGNTLKYFDENLNLIWEKILNSNLETIHHEIIKSNDTAFYFLSSELNIRKSYKNRILSGYTNPNFKMNKDTLKYDIIYSMDIYGNILFKWNTFEYFDEIYNLISENRDSNYLKNFNWYFPEFTHFNSLQSLPKNSLEELHPEFAEGNILFSDIAYKFIGIIDKNTKKIVWSYFQDTSGMGQHSARMLDNNNILFFTNQFLDKNKNKYSKVIEINPLTKETVWEFTASPPESFFSQFDGNAQRLKNGNTLITVNNFEIEGINKIDTTYPNHYAFEVTKNKKIVWKWIPKDFNKFNKSTEGFYRIERVSKNELPNLKIK